MDLLSLFCLICAIGIHCASGSVVNLAFKKDAYVGSSYKPASHGVDGDRSTFALCLFPYWFVVDLGSAYNVQHVIVETRTDCCGDRMNKFKVGLLKTFDRNNFTKNILCGEYPENTTKNKSYRVNCSHSRQRYRYVLLYVEDQDVPDAAPGIVKDMNFAELKVYGDDRGNFLFQYFGCFERGAGASGSDVSSIEECITVCQRSTYAGLEKGSQCVCLDNLPALLPTSRCTSKCSGDEDHCAGNGALSVYKVQECRDQDQLMPCIHHCKEFKQTPRVGCLKGRCEAGWAGEQCLLRNCSRRPCGEHACVVFSLASTRFSECVCKPGFEKRGHFSNDCTDIDECAIEGACGAGASNCTNSEGSFKCECKSGFYLNSSNKCQDPSTNTLAIVLGVVVCLVLLLLLALLIICCIRRRSREKKSGQTEREATETLASRFGLNKSLKKMYFGKNKAATTNESSSEQSTDVVDNSPSLAGLSRADMSLRGAIEVYEEIGGGEEITRIRLQDVKDYLVSNSNTILSHFNRVPLKSEVGICEGKKKKNQQRNKYKDIFPFDHNRVKLKGQSNDYINASHIKSYRPDEYNFIASQGIKHKEEIENFWKMVLQNDVCVIVMLTSLTENNKEKCLQYWPDSNMEGYGSVQVSVQSIRKWQHYEIRKFVVVDKETAVTHEVTHLSYLSWPDHAVPSNVASLLNVRHISRQLVREKVHATAKPACVLVHCSAGVGRTGTMIAVDTLIEEGKETAHVNPLKCLRDLRKQRNFMIQNNAQYLFCYKAIATHVLLGDTTTFNSNQSLLEDYLSQDEQDLHRSLSDQVELISDSRQKSHIAKGKAKEKLTGFESYPGFSKTQAFSLVHFEATTPETSLRENILESSFVLTIDEETIDTLCGLFGSQDCSNISATDCVVVRDVASGRHLKLRGKKTHKESDNNHVYANSALGANELKMRSLELGSDVTECYKACSDKLRDVNEMPILILYTSEYRQECLWSVMKMYLLQMAEDCGEVDVFQTVYHVYNSIPFQSSPPPSNYYNAPSPPSSQHLELNVNTYKNMYDFALSIYRKGRLEGPRAEKLEEDNYHKAQKRNNVYNNEALCYSNDETKKIINRTYEKKNNIGNSNNNNNNNNNNNVITNMTKSLYPSKEGEIGEKDNSY